MTSAAPWATPRSGPDLLGEGIPGLLRDAGDAWYFKRNLGDGTPDSSVVVMAKPRGPSRGGGMALVAVAGDGGLAATGRHPADLMRCLRELVPR